MYSNSFSTPTRRKLKRSSLSAGLLMAVPALLMADVPFTFVGGEVADPNEVNANFTDLDDRLSALELPTVSVNCGSDGAGALQGAVNATPLGGQVINVTGPCGPVEVVSKQNLVINGGGTTTITGNGSSDHALAVALSPSVIINGVTVDGNNVGDAAVNVGASTAIFTNLVAYNGGYGALSVNAHGVAILLGTSSLGDGDDSVGVEMDMRGTLEIEGSGTIRGTAVALDMEDYSLFKHRADGNVSNTLTVTGRTDLSGASSMIVENGSLTGDIAVAGGSFIARPENGLTVAIAGNVTVNAAVLTLDASTAGSAVSLTGNSLANNFGSVTSWLGSGIAADPNEVVLYSNSGMYIDGVTVDADTQFQVLVYSNLLSTTAMNAANVVCNNAAALSIPSGDLCITPPDPNAP